MYSTPGEPGFTANYLLFGFALTATLLAVPGDGWAFTRRELRLFTAFLGATLVLSTGTTGYGGVVIFLGLLATAFVLVPALRPPELGRILAVAAVGTLVTGALVATFSPGVLDVVVFQARKVAFQTGSGNIRLFYVRRSLAVFAARPLLGAGVGSHSAPSYVATLLAETGLLGVITLGGAHLLAVRGCAGLLEATDPETRRRAAALGVAGLTLFATNFVAKSIASLLLPWYWFAFALPVAFVALCRDDEDGGGSPSALDRRGTSVTHKSRRSGD